MHAPLVLLSGPLTGGPLLVDMGPLLPEHPIEIIVGIVLLLIVTWATAKFIVPRFETMYHERTEEIQGGIERAEKAQAEVDFGGNVGPKWLVLRFAPLQKL